MRPWKFLVGIGLMLVALAGVYFGSQLPSSSPTAEQEMTEEQFAQSLAESHIQGNVPADKDFLPFLQRDLNGHFGGQAGTPAVQRVEMLREGPTQWETAPTGCCCGSETFEAPIGLSLWMTLAQTPRVEISLTHRRD